MRQRRTASVTRPSPLAQCPPSSDDRDRPTVRLAAVAVGLAALAAACGGGGGSSAEAPPGCTTADGQTLTVIGTDKLKFDQECYTVGSGQVTFDYKLSPESNQIHDLRIDGQAGLFLEIDALTREAVGSVGLAPGRYDLFCSISGHREAGMEAELFIS